MTHPPVLDPPTPGPLLARLADEVAACARLLTAIEAEVALLIPASPVQNRNALDALQKIDLLAQTLGDLALCLDGLARAALPPPATAGWAAAALGPLRLGDVRLRLAGLPVPATALARHADVDLF